jgi:hypothetical protein
VITRYKALCRLVVLGAVASAMCAAQIPTPAPSFTMTAGSVAMPLSGLVTIPITFTSVNGFNGMVYVQCVAPTVAAGVRAPFCQDGGPAMASTLTANGTATAGIEIISVLPNVVPAVRASNFKRDHGESWALAGVLMLGFGLRRRSRRFMRAMLAVAGIGVLAMGLSGCGGPPTLTPGAYVFTLNANSTGDINPSVTASTTATVTVPAGIVTKTAN